MALSLALDLIGGPVFEGLSASVSRAMDRDAAFIDLLQHIDHTLKSLKNQAGVISQIQQYNVELGLSTIEIMRLSTEMGNGRTLVDKLSGIKFRLWNFFCCCCTSNCAEQLRKLNRELESLFMTLQLELIRDIKEILSEQRKNSKKIDKMMVMLDKRLQKTDDPEVKGLLKNLVEQNSGGSTETSTSTSASGSNTQDEGHGVTQASFKGLVQEAFQLLINAVEEVMMFKPLLRCLKSTLDCLRPFIEEMAQDNKVLDHPKEELEKLRIQMENGVNLIRKCSSVCRWTSNKKDKYTKQVFELDEFLQGQLSILTVRVARDVKGTSELIRKIKEVVKRIEGSDVVENRVEFQGSCDIIEPSVPPVEFQGSCDITEPPVPPVKFQDSCDITEPPVPQERMPNFSEMSKMRPFIKDIRTDARRIAENFRVYHQKTDPFHGWGAVPVGAPFTVGVDEPLRELKIKLLKDEKVSMLVLTAIGGCGKTTLAIKFCEDYEVKDKFKDNIFFVTVSKKSDGLVVQELYQRMGSKIPTLQSKVDVDKWLQQFLIGVGKNPVLFVLDDVWPESESLLQKFDDFKLPNSKILVTSRFQFPRFGTQLCLKALNVEDAMTLFKHSASLGDRSSYVLEDIIREIVEHFKESPLAITVVGRSLCGKSAESWLKRASALKGASILNSEAALKDGLQSSLDALNEEDPILKECFLDLGSFPEDRRIPAAALIDMWAELYKLKDFESIANLDELATRSLANLLITRKEKMEADGYYSEHFITQHDLLRQLAIYQPNLDPNNKRRIIDKWGDNLPECLTEQKHQPIKARLLSITSDGTFSTNLHNIQLADVEVLVLNFNTKNYALPEFVENMYNLKVLIVTNLGFVPAELSNFHLLDSLPNLKRIRLERVSIPSITKHRVQLKSLKKISLFMCNIGQAFSNCSFQISDALPNLEEMNVDYCNDLVELPAALCALVNLKKLSITNSHKLSALPEKIGELVNLEALRLRSCTDLAMLPGSSTNLKKLNFLDIADCFSIKELPEDFGEMSSLKKINMRQCSRLQELPSSVLDLEHLREVVCDEDTGDLWEPFLPNIRNLRIKLVKENVNLDWLQKLE